MLSWWMCVCVCVCTYSAEGSLISHINHFPSQCQPHTLYLSLGASPLNEEMMETGEYSILCSGENSETFVFFTPFFFKNIREVICQI